MARCRPGLKLRAKDLERAEAARALIAAAPAQLVERDGQVWTVRRLPAAAPARSTTRPYRSGPTHAAMAREPISAR